MALNLKKYAHVNILRLYSSLPAENVPVIKVPPYVTKYIEKKKQLREERRMAVLKKIIYRGDTSFPVIASNIKEYNFYYGQIYNKKFPIPLLSKYWMKAKSSGQKFAIMPWGENPSLPLDLQIPPEVLASSDENSMARVITEFHEMKLSLAVLQGIKALGYKQPTPIQAKVIPKVQEDKHLVCVSESGSGKTMAYIIPIMDSLRRWKEKQQRYPNTPLALVICPGRELAEQIAISAYQLGELCGITVKLAIPEGTKHKFLRPNNYEPFDLLVATFGTVRNLLDKCVMNLSHLKHLVMDEADTLLDDSFIEEQEMFLRKIMTKDTLHHPDLKQYGAQMIFSSTTYPKNVLSLFDNFTGEDSLQKAISPFIHRVPCHIQQKFVRVRNENRVAHFLELINNDVQKKIPVMVFCNKSITCDFLSYLLRDNNVTHVKFHAGMKFEEREESFHRFQSGDVDVFVCTDLASRGLDTQRARHIINFDFPNNESDYLFRAGRVGRIGTNHGHLTNLIVSKSGVYVVQNIEMSVRTSHNIEGVDANVKKKINKLYTFRYLPSLTKETANESSSSSE